MFALRRPAQLAALIIGVHVTAAAQAPLELIERDRLAKPVTVVAPDFPRGVNAPAGGARVDVRGAVQLDGRLLDIEVVAAPGAEAFATAVQRVIDGWRFEPEIDGSACAPRISRVEMAVWFEGSGDEGKVFVSYPRPQTDAPHQSSGLLFAAAPPIRFPRGLLHLEGKVVALLSVDESAKVTAVSVLSSTPYGAFDAAVLANARQTQLRWSADAQPRRVCVSRSYRFCVEGRGADIRLPECRR